MKSLFIAPHNDDETLWGAFTLMREKPVVVVITDSFIQANRGENITYFQRREETINAMKILGCLSFFLGIPDDNFSEARLNIQMPTFHNFDRVYVPAIQGGNPQHDIIGKVYQEMFGNRCKHYTTYTKTEPYTTGNIEIVPTIEEIELKDKALDCYKSQIGNTNKVYFDAVRGRSEWLM